MKHVFIFIWPTVFYGMIITGQSCAGEDAVCISNDGKVCTIKMPSLQGLFIQRLVWLFICITEVLNIVVSSSIQMLTY